MEGCASPGGEGGQLAEVTGRHLIESLEASFEAAVVRREDEAASDLALSLLQGRTLTDIAGREGGWDLRCPDGRTLPITLVGRDFLGAGQPPSVLVPSGRAVLARAATDHRPQSSDISLVEELRGLADFGATVRVEAECGPLHGILARVGPDHLVLRTGMGEHIIGLDGISLLALGPRDDAP